MKHILFILLFIFSASGLSAQTNLYVLGNQAMAEGDYRQAEEYYSSALVKEPQNWNIMSQLGYCLFKQQRYGEADSLFNIVISNDATVEKAWWYKGFCAMKTGKDSVAVVCFKAYLPLAKKMGGNLIGAYVYVGKSYRNMLRKDGLTYDQVEDMLYHFQQVERLDPSNPELPDYMNFTDQVKKNRPAREAGRWKFPQ